MADQKDGRDLPSPVGVDFDLPGSKKFGVSNVADFWVRPSDRYILLDLLLEEISGIREPPWVRAKILQK